MPLSKFNAGSGPNKFIKVKLEVIYYEPFKESKSEIRLTQMNVMNRYNIGGFVLYFINNQIKHGGGMMVSVNNHLDITL